MENNNNIEDKYYTPAIEEVRVGSMCDILYEGEWVENCTITILDSIESLSEQIKSNSIRVKYLDKEDIEILGFSPRLERSTTHIGYDNANSFLFKKELTFPLFENIPDLKTVYLIYKGPNDRSVLYLTRNRYVGIDDNIILPEIQLFNGYIKNISELQQLLHRLGIL